MVLVNIILTYNLVFSSIFFSYTCWRNTILSFFLNEICMLFQDIIWIMEFVGKRSINPAKVVANSTKLSYSSPTSTDQKSLCMGSMTKHIARFGTRWQCSCQVTTISWYILRFNYVSKQKFIGSCVCTSIKLLWFEDIDCDNIRLTDTWRRVNQEIWKSRKGISSWIQDRKKDIKDLMA